MPVGIHSELHTLCGSKQRIHLPLQPWPLAELQGAGKPSYTPGPFAYRPVALLEELEAFPSTGGVTGAGVPPEDPSEQVVLLDSAGGGPRLAERSLLAWRPHAHLWSKNGHTVVSSRSGGRGWRTTIGPEDPFSA